MQTASRVALGQALCGPVCAVVAFLLDAPSVGAPTESNKEVGQEPTLREFSKSEAKGAAAGIIGGKVLGQFGKLGSKAATEALETVSKGTAEEGIKISKGLGETKTVIPTRQEAEKLIAKAGGTVQRAEKGTGATVSTHTYPHINYKIGDKEFAVRVQSVGRQFDRAQKYKFTRNRHLRK